MSMTSFLKSFHKEKDWDQIAEAYLSKRSHEEVLQDLSKKWGIPFEKAVNKWGHCDTKSVPWIRSVWREKSRIATDPGTYFHDYMEKKDGKKDNVHDNYLVDGVKYSIDLNSLKPGITYPELIVYSHRHKLAGQVDKPIVLDNGKVRIRDYKTSNTIDMIPKKFWKKGVNGGKATMQSEHFLPPISHLDAINFIDYSLQLSGYAYILELYGYEIETLWIDHVVTEYINPKAHMGELIIAEEPEFDRIRIFKEIIPIQAEYLKPEIEALFRHREIDVNGW